MHGGWGEDLGAEVKGFGEGGGDYTGFGVGSCEEGLVAGYFFGVEGCCCG